MRPKYFGVLLTTLMSKSDKTLLKIVKIFTCLAKIPHTGDKKSLDRCG